MRELVDFIVLIILYIFVFYKKWKLKGRDVLLINTLMYIYLSFVLYFTLMPIITSIPVIFNHIIFNRQYESMNLRPFIDITLRRGDFMRQVALNVIMTIPFGFLFPLARKKDTKILKVILYTFLLSLSIELLQLFTNGGRSSDITDIITNVAGGIIGYIIFIIMKPITTKILKFIKISKEVQNVKNIKNKNIN